MIPTKQYILDLIERERSNAAVNLARAELQLKRCRPEFVSDNEFLAGEYRKILAQAEAAKQYVEAN